VFSGNPAGANCTGNPEACDRYGTEFSLSGGALWMGELQYAVNQGDDAKGLAATYKIGGWFHTGEFADQEFGVGPNGRPISLATIPTPKPLNHQGDWNLYGIADQMLWRGDSQTVSVFARGGIAPGDRNLVSWYVDGGIGVGGLIPGRDNDTLTVGAAYSKISSEAADLDRQRRALDGPYPIRDGEAAFELTYQAQIAPWWNVQPDLQYIVHPGGNVPSEKNTARAIGNALVVGVRSTVTF
jgi:porin